MKIISAFILTIGLTLVANAAGKKDKQKANENYRKAKAECLQQNSSLRGKALQHCIRTKK